jgi:hypothetical protein
VHVLLNGFDMYSQGFDVKIILEGPATALLPELSRSGNPLESLYMKVKELRLIDAVCRTCATQNEVLEAVELEGLPIADENSGHPSMGRYIELGYEIIRF